MDENLVSFASLPATGRPGEESLSGPSSVKAIFHVADLVGMANSFFANYVDIE